MPSIFRAFAARHDVLCLLIALLALLVFAEHPFGSAAAPRPADADSKTLDDGCLSAPSHGNEEAPELQPQQRQRQQEATASKTKTQTVGRSMPVPPSSAPPRAVLERFALGSGPWKTFDPFLFCVHHLDLYPAAHADTVGLDPRHLRGRDVGSDFSYKDGFSLYHGQRGVPGFPVHPHRGMETITITRRGVIDHSDSCGATARYGGGDVQWMTAGAGLQHAEMFPLINRDSPNVAELFQLWLNLPKATKMVPPHFTMFWANDVPTVSLDGGRVSVRVIAGRGADYFAPESAVCQPPPDSFAAQPDADVAIWEISLQPGTSVTLPAARSRAANRAVYVFTAERGTGVRLADAVGSDLAARNGAKVDATGPLALTAYGDAPVGVLVLQGRPIGEPVVHHGPFVMNTQAEIEQTFADFRRTQFGGWPWKEDDPVHPRGEGRFAKHMDGRVERPALQ